MMMLPPPRGGHAIAAREYAVHWEHVLRCPDCQAIAEWSQDCKGPRPEPCHHGESLWSGYVARTLTPAPARTAQPPTAANRPPRASLGEVFRNLVAHLRP